MAGIDHRPAPFPTHHLSPLAHEFRSTVNSPIFACRSRLSPSWSPRLRSAPFEKTPFIPSGAGEPPSDADGVSAARLVPLSPAAVEVLMGLPHLQDSPRVVSGTIESRIMS